MKQWCVPAPLLCGLQLFELHYTPDMLTNNVAAIVKGKKGPSNSSLYTEEDWNDESSLTNGPYMYSKVCDTAEHWLSNTPICFVCFNQL